MGYFHEAASIKNMQVVIHSSFATCLYVGVPLSEYRVNLAAIESATSIVFTDNDFEQFFSQIHVPVHAYPFALMPYGHAELIA
ncbi:hypothetical protein D3C77_687280 [compost metagenome]